MSNPDPRSFLEESPQLDTTIVRWSQLSLEAKNILLPQLKEIFFESSSKKKFTNEDERNTFFDRWCGDYLKHYAEFSYLMVDQASNLLCYLVLCPNSLQGLDFLNISSLEIFKEEFSNFPAHLHMNTHANYRGLGLGHTILVAVEADLKSKRIHGLHLVTEKQERNFKFYEKNGFTHIVEKDFNTRKLCFMGKSLS